MALRVLVTGGKNIGLAGVATMTYAYGCAMDPELVVYDYLMQNGISDVRYRAEIESRGGKVYELKSAKTGLARFLSVCAWYVNILKNGGYTVLHINCDSAFVASWYLLLARLRRLPTIIVHGHCTEIDDNVPWRRVVKTALHRFCRLFVRMADYRFGCSVMAAEFMFGRRYVSRHPCRVIHNGIDVRQFVFSPAEREKCRNALGLSGKSVFGVVGRLSYQKNHELLLDAFGMVFEQTHDAALLIAGDGELRKALEDKARDMGPEISRNIFFLGNRHDVPSLLCAMDVFVLPSRFEGLGIVYVEAQASGLPTLASDKVAPEAFITDLIRKVSLDAGAEAWAGAMRDAAHSGGRRNMYEDIRAAGYEISDVGKDLQDFYLGLSQEYKKRRQRHAGSIRTDERIQ